MIADRVRVGARRSRHAMFIVTAVRHRFLLWVSVVIEAETDFSMTDDRLKLDRVGTPMLETRRIAIAAGETFTINARRSDGYKVGDRVPLDRVANRLPVNLKWQTISSA